MITQINSTNLGANLVRRSNLTSNLLNAHQITNSFQNIFNKNINTSPPFNRNIIGSDSIIHGRFEIGERVGSIASMSCAIIDGDWIKLRKIANFDPESPVIVAIGVNFGKEFEVAVNINNIDPRNASYVEMAALAALLQEKGIISNTHQITTVGKLTFHTDGTVDGRRCFFEKKNFLETLQERYEQEKQVGSLFDIIVMNLRNFIFFLENHYKLNLMDLR